MNTPIEHDTYRDAYRAGWEQREREVAKEIERIKQRAETAETELKRLREPRYCDAEYVCSECAGHNRSIGLTSLGLTR